MSNIKHQSKAIDDQNLFTLNVINWINDLIQGQDPQLGFKTERSTNKTKTKTIRTNEAKMIQTNETKMFKTNETKMIRTNEIESIRTNETKTIKFNETRMIKTIGTRMIKTNETKVLMTRNKVNAISMQSGPIRSRYSDTAV
jgi:hypothetical protein